MTIEDPHPSDQEMLLAADGELSARRAAGIRTHLAVIRRVQSERRYKKGSYEMRFLRIPSLDLNAMLWLKPLGGGQDVVIPMASTSFLRPGWHYSIPMLFKTLRKHAQRRLTASNVPAPSNQG